MLYKPDWEQAKERFQAFWQGEIVDRCCIAVTAPKDNGHGGEYAEKYSVERFRDDDTDSIRAWWCDPEENVRRSEFLFSNTFVGGEALPIAFTNWGAMAMCAFYGCQPVFNKTSVWYHKIIDSWDTWEFRLDKETNPYWRTTKEITAAFAAAAPSKFLAGLPELGSAGDILSLLRGMDNLCLDLYDHPEAVKAAIETFTKDFLSLQDDLYAITQPASYGGGVLPWMSLDAWQARQSASL